MHGMAKKTIISAVVLLLFSMGLLAQEAIVSSGNEASGTGGSASFSVGQVAYVTLEAENGSVAQGVQQVFDVTISSSPEILMDEASMLVFPNPSSSSITIELNTPSFTSAEVRIVDAHGKPWLIDQLQSIRSRIDLSALPAGSYFLVLTPVGGNPIRTKFIKQ